MAAFKLITVTCVYDSEWCNLEKQWRNSLFFLAGHVPIRWMCHSHTYRWWLHEILHNYEHFFTQKLYQLWKVWSPFSLCPRIVPMSCLCPRNAAAFLWRVAFRYWPMIHHRWIFVSVGIYSHTLNGNQLVQLRGCLRSFIQINV
jgi:hypothetical protein